MFKPISWDSANPRLSETEFWHQVWSFNASSGHGFVTTTLHFLPNPWFFMEPVQNHPFPGGGGISRSLAVFPGHWPAFPGQPPGISRSLAGIPVIGFWSFGQFSKILDFHGFSLKSHSSTKFGKCCKTNDREMPANDREIPANDREIPANDREMPHL